MLNYQKLKILLEQLDFKKEDLEFVNIWRCVLSPTEILRIDIEEINDQYELTFLNRNDQLYKFKIKDHQIKSKLNYIKLHIMNFKDIVKVGIDIPSLTLIELTSSPIEDIAFTMIYYTGRSCLCQKVCRTDKSYKNEILDFLRIKKLEHINLTVINKNESFKLKTSYKVLEEKLTKKFELNQLEQLITK